MFGVGCGYQGFCMTVVDLEAVAAIAVSLSILMALVRAAPVLSRDRRPVRLCRWQRVGRQPLPDEGGGLIVERGIDSSCPA
jgi:hypothetical protein